MFSGRRRSEVLNLTAKNIEVEGETAYYTYRGKGGKNGRRELPRPAYEAIRVTLADAGLDLATMDQHGSLWQVAGSVHGQVSTGFPSVPSGSTSFGFGALTSTV